MLLHLKPLKHCCKLSYISTYMVLCSTDSHWSVSLKVLEGNIIWPNSSRMLKFHPITAFMKMHANFKKKFLIRVFWFKYIFPIKYRIRILDLMLLPKHSVPLKRLYYSSKISLLINDKMSTLLSFNRISAR